MSDLLFNQFNVLPDGFLTAQTTELYDLLGKPTLIYLEGEIKQPLFICTLLHGNETTGFYAIQNMLRHYQDSPLPRSIILFIGNVEAAASKQRRLDNQNDYNRTWKKAGEADCNESQLMQQITQTVQEANPFASIDIHNNTGRNPHYACVTTLDGRALPLAGMFSNTVVYFTRPSDTQASRFAEFCPSIVLECGVSGDTDGITHSHRFLDAALNLDHIQSGAVEHISLYHTVARVTIPTEFSVGIEDSHDVSLYQHIESLNFHELDVGTAIADINNANVYLNATDNEDNNVYEKYFEIISNKLVLKKKATPSMFTTNTKAIKQDCLCYLMEKIRH